MSEVDTKALRRKARDVVDGDDVVDGLIWHAADELDRLRAEARGHDDIVANLRGNLTYVQEEYQRVALELEDVRQGRTTVDLTNLPRRTPKVCDLGPDEEQADA